MPKPSKPETRRRYDDPTTYLEELRAHRADPDNVAEPAHHDVEVVEAKAVQNGKVVTIRIAAEDAPAYEKALADAVARGTISPEDAE